MDPLVPIPVFIYGLYCPETGALRYVGKADNVAKRLASHIKSCRLLNYPLSLWIRELQSRGLAPEPYVLRKTDSEKWKADEREIIAGCRAVKIDLLNLANGGDAPSISLEQRQKNAAKMNEANRNETLDEWGIHDIKIRISRFLYQAKQSGSKELVDRMQAACRRLAIAHPQHYGSLVKF